MLFTHTYTHASHCCVEAEPEREGEGKEEETSFWGWVMLRFLQHASLSDVDVLKKERRRCFGVSLFWFFSRC